MRKNNDFESLIEKGDFECLNWENGSKHLTKKVALNAYEGKWWLWMPIRENGSKCLFDSGGFERLWLWMSI